MQRLDHLGERLRDGLTSLFSRKRIPAQVVGMGSLFGIHFLDGGDLELSRFGSKGYRYRI